MLGPDPLLLAALERRLAEVGVAAGRPGHRGRAGRRRLGRRGVRRGGARAGRTWGARGWWGVSAAFASAAEPTVEEAVADLRAAGAPRVAVATYLLFPGLFADRLAAAGADVTSAPLADAPEVVALVLARYDAAVTSLP